MSKVAKAAVGLMIATVLVKIIGFVREQILSFVYGAGMYTDVYFATMNIPNVIFAGIGAALSTTFIPLYCDIEKNRGEEQANKFTVNIMTIVISICIVIAILGTLFTKQLLKVFAMGFTGERLLVGVDFTRILILSIVFIGISNVLTAYLQVKNNFVIPGLISLPQNLIVIVSIFLSEIYGPYSIVWGTLLGIASQILLQLPFVYKKGLKMKLYINLKDSYLKKMIILTGPVFIGVAINQINTTIDKNLASMLPVGSISALSYADKLNSFILSMFITSIIAVVYPMLSKLSQNNEKEMFSKYISMSCNSIILLVLPISVGAIVLSTPIVQILFERGEFNNTDTIMTSVALAMYSIGLVGYGLREIINKVFYSLQDTKTPMINAIISMVLNIILNLILVKKMGHSGLALGTSISALICTLLLFISLSKKVKYFGQDKIFKTTIKSLISSIIMGIVVYYGYSILLKYLGIGLLQQIISISLTVLLGVIVYGSIIIIFKVEEISVILNMLKKKVKR